ncbi:MAG: ABC transporter substrate-binding protein [Clostridiales bacterium]|nr:ABC transporter substrate-binding protein [Clostridiales bacterium]
MKKKILAAILSTAMVATLLTGCGGSADATADTSAADTETETAEADTAAETETAEETEAEASGEVTYEECTLTFDWWGGDSRHEATQAAVDAFMTKYPGITVEVNFGAWTDWETAKAAEYLSGNNPDVQQTNFDWIGKYDADGETYLDLNTVSDVLDLTQYDQSTLDTAMDSKGGLAGIPVSITGRTFYWNQATFEQAGLSVPTTLDELLAAGPVFQEKLGDNYYPLVVGEYDRAILMAFYLQAQTGEPVINESGNFTLTEDQVKEGLAWIQSLEEAHVIPTIAYIDGEGADSMDKSARFINGEYAGIFEWDSSPAKYLSALGENSGDLVVGNEIIDGVFKKVSLMFSISATTEHPKEAALLLNYLLNDEEGAAIMSTERGIPESKSAYAVLEAAGAIGAMEAEAHAAVMDADPMYWNPLFDDSSLKGDTAVYTTVFEQFSYGQDASGAAYTIDDAASDLYNAYIAVAPAE